MLTPGARTATSRNVAYAKHVDDALECGIDKIVTYEKNVESSLALACHGCEANMFRNGADRI